MSTTVFHFVSTHPQTIYILHTLQMQQGNLHWYFRVGSTWHKQTDHTQYILITHSPNLFLDHLPFKKTIILEVWKLNHSYNHTNSRFTQNHIYQNTSLHSRTFIRTITMPLFTLTSSSSSSSSSFRSSTITEAGSSSSSCNCNMHLATRSISIHGTSKNWTFLLNSCNFEWEFMFGLKNKTVLSDHVEKSSCVVY